MQEWMRPSAAVGNQASIANSAIALNSKLYHKFFLNHLPSGGYFLMASDRWQGWAS
ncbi:hypothetical protein [Microcoleus sp. M2_C6]|uniref:hypothetical protein n=2 Tax=unclassified Microcoleus TaxID=2642155 RepID=UPI002FD40C39